MNGEGRRAELAYRAGGGLVLVTLLVMVASAVTALTAEAVAPGFDFSDPNLTPGFTAARYGDRVGLFVQGGAGFYSCALLVFGVMAVAIAGGGDTSAPDRQRPILVTAGVLAATTAVANYAMAALIATEFRFNALLNPQFSDARVGNTFEHLSVAAFATGVAWYASQVLSVEDDVREEMDAE